MSEHVFICYAREDAQFVLTLVKQLRERGVSAWLDRINIRPGEDWDHAIDKALYECTNFLIVLSPNAVESREVSCVRRWSRTNLSFLSFIVRVRFLANCER